MNGDVWQAQLALDIEAGVYDSHAGDDDPMGRDPRDEGPGQA